jgi:hypothetical protein
VKKRQKTSKSAKNRKTPVNPRFFAFFQKRRISFETSIGIFPQKRVFSCFLGVPGGPGFWGSEAGFWGPRPVFGVLATRRFRKFFMDLVFGPDRDLAQGGSSQGPAMHEQDVFNVMMDCDEVVVSLHEVHQSVQCCKMNKSCKKMKKK